MSHFRGGVRQFIPGGREGGAEVHVASTFKAIRPAAGGARVGPAAGGVRVGPAAGGARVGPAAGRGEGRAGSRG
jgi:hypothetical protein